MIRPRSSLLIAALVLSTALLFADDKPPVSSKTSAPKMSDTTRLMVVRGLNAELVFIRRQFPMGVKGLTIKDGKVTPNEDEVQRLTAAYGPAVKPGDRARITAVTFKGDKTIVFEINGGPKKKQKWWQHIQVSGMGGTATAPGDPNSAPDANPRGSYVELVFDKYVPEMKIDDIKQLLMPVFDFNAKSAAEAYMDTLPPKLKEAIKNHEVLVGMNREMVTYAKGRPPKKYRERQGETEYEEWIYGEPPNPVEFVRFVGDEVVRLEVMKVSGEKVVRTDKEIDIKPTVAQQHEKREEAEPKEAAPVNRPTLRRPGESAAGQPAADTPRSPLPGQTGTGPTQNPMPTGTPGGIPPL